MFHRSEFLQGNTLGRSFDAKKVQQSRDWYEPTVPACQSTQQLLGPPMDDAIPDKATSKVRIHNADTTFRLETILVQFAKRFAEACRISSPATAKPIIDEGPRLVVIWHRWIYPIQVDFSKDEIANVVYRAAA